jgi:hypothetical protein
VPTPHGTWLAIIAASIAARTYEAFGVLRTSFREFWVGNASILW